MQQQCTHCLKQNSDPFHFQTENLYFCDKFCFHDYCKLSGNNQAIEAYENFNNVKLYYKFKQCKVCFKQFRYPLNIIGINVKNNTPLQSQHFCDWECYCTQVNMVVIDESERSRLYAKAEERAERRIITKERTIKLYFNPKKNYDCSNCLYCGCVITESIDTKGFNTIIDDEWGEYLFHNWECFVWHTHQNQNVENFDEFYYNVCKRARRKISMNIIPNTDLKKYGGTISCQQFKEQSKLGLADEDKKLAELTDLMCKTNLNDKYKEEDDKLVTEEISDMSLIEQEMYTNYTYDNCKNDRKRLNESKVSCNKRQK